MFYSQEQIDRANQVNLEDFLRTQGETLTRSGKEYRWKCHDSLPSGAINGSAIARARAATRWIL